MTALGGKRAWPVGSPEVPLCAQSCRSVERRFILKTDIPSADLLAPGCSKWKVDTGPGWAAPTRAKPTEAHVATAAAQV